MLVPFNAETKDGRNEEGTLDLEPGRKSRNKEQQRSEPFLTEMQVHMQKPALMNLMFHIILTFTVHLLLNLAFRDSIGIGRMNFSYCVAPFFPPAHHQDLLGILKNAYESK